jgi:hypothetical protein
MNADNEEDDADATVVGELIDILLLRSVILACNANVDGVGLTEIETEDGEDV